MTSPRLARHEGTFLPTSRYRSCTSRIPVEASHFQNVHQRNTQMAKDKTLQDLFNDTLKDIYYAERKILKALPKMARERFPRRT